MFSKKQLIVILNEVIESKDDTSSDENIQKLIIVRDALDNAQTREEILSAVGKFGPFFLKLFEIYKDYN